MEQPSVGLKCLYLLLNPPNIFELLISVGFESIAIAVTVDQLRLQRIGIVVLFQFTHTHTVTMKYVVCGKTAKASEVKKIGEDRMTKRPENKCLITISSLY